MASAKVDFVDCSFLVRRPLLEVGRVQLQAAHCLPGGASHRTKKHPPSLDVNVHAK